MKSQGRSLFEGDRLAIGGIRFNELSIRQQGNNVLIANGNERLLLLLNTKVGQITQADLA